MDFEDVFERFVVLTGLELSEAEKWSFLCDDAIESIRKLLKPDVNESECRSRLTAAAGILSCYKFAMLEMSNEPSSFSAGDLKFGYSSSKLENVSRLWEEAKSEIKDLIIDDCFSFTSIKYRS